MGHDKGRKAIVLHPDGTVLPHKKEETHHPPATSNFPPNAPAFLALSKSTTLAFCSALLS